MTTHTTPAATPSTGFLTSTPVFWSLLAAIAATLLVLTSWTAAQASAINDIVDGNGPDHPSIRQLEREAEQDTSQHLSIRQLERAAAADVDGASHVSVRQVERADQVRRKQLAQLEAGEARRFTNRTDAAVHDTVAQTDQISAAPVDFAGLTADDLTRLEYNELRRFRNRAPVGALPTLDDAIAQLRAAVA